MKSTQITKVIATSPHKVGQKELLIEQRSSVSWAGPSAYPSITLNVGSSEHQNSIWTLVERRAVKSNRTSEVGDNQKSVLLENKTACELLCDVIPIKRCVMDWDSGVIAYLASGGMCPPLKCSSKPIKQSVSVQALLPIHLLLQTSCSKPNTPCVVEPVIPYYLSVLKEDMQSKMMLSQTLSKNALDHDDGPHEEWTQMENELYRRFGKNLKVNKMTVTHCYGDIVALAFGFAAGLRTKKVKLLSRTYTDVEEGRRTSSYDDSDDEDDHSKIHSELDEKKTSDAESSEDTVCSSSHAPQDAVYCPDTLEPPVTCISATPVQFTDNVAMNPSHYPADTLYHQTSKVFGKVRRQKRERAECLPQKIQYESSIGVLMAPGVEALIISLGCPAVDVVPIMMDPSNFTSEQMCKVIRKHSIKSIAVDEIGFELLMRTYDLWCLENPSSNWSVNTIITGYYFDNLNISLGKSNGLMRNTNLIDLNDLIVKDFPTALARLLKWRVSLPYSSVKIDDQSRFWIYPRVVSMCLDLNDFSLYAPVWSCQLMNSVAGVLALENNLDWKLESRDTVMITRMETPTSEGIYEPTNCEAATSYLLSLCVLVSGGRVAMVPLIRLIFQGFEVLDVIRKMKPTIAVGSNAFWITFAKRLCHEAKMDGASSKAWRQKVLNKRLRKSDDRTTQATNDHASSTNKTDLKKLLMRKIIDPLAFRRGRHLLGNSIRLAVVSEPLDGFEVMHERTLETLTMLLSSSSEMKLIQCYATSGLGPCSVVSTSVISSSHLLKQQSCTPLSGHHEGSIQSCGLNSLPVHTGDPHFNARCTLARQKSLVRTLLPHNFVDADVAAIAIGPCLVNASLEMMMSGVDEEAHPVLPNGSGKKFDVLLYKLDMRESRLGSNMVCRVSKAIRLESGLCCTPSGSPLREFVKGSFAQIQDGLVSGPLFPRICTDAVSCDVMRTMSIGSFLKAHCFHIMNIKYMRCIDSDKSCGKGLLSKSAARTKSQYENSKRPVIEVDMDVELNPLNGELTANIHPGDSITEQVKDITRTRGISLLRVLTGSPIAMFGLFWARGLLPDGGTFAEDNENCPLREKFDDTHLLSSDTMAAISDVISLHCMSLSVETCTSCTNGLSGK
eukprot:GHVH01006991.1.p1 GENE.GHVH01006991.1~~GHVH01006991.1.p1  ORF type:complete len:1157 (+),score=157.90 GHVH01006991.1:110-3472(+)